MTPLAAKALEFARASLGVTEHPRGSNRGPEIDEYLRVVGIEPTAGTPKDREWCAAFATTMVIRAANSIPCPRIFRGSASVHRLLELNPALELAEPEPGCVFIHLNDDGKGHTGFVTEVLGGGIVSTIEGNSDAHGSRTGGSVVEGTRPRSYVAHWIRIA